LRDIDLEGKIRAVGILGLKECRRTGVTEDVSEDMAKPEGRIRDPGGVPWLRLGAGA